MITVQKPTADIKNNEDAFAEFARENRKFIMRCASRCCKRIIDESDDEWSVALIAFYEAVKQYSDEKGSFSSFAKLVIKRRLMDYFDTQSKYKQMEIPAAPEVINGELPEEPTVTEIKIAQAGAMMEAHERPGTTPLQDEVAELERILIPYGFTLFDVAADSPKTGKTKRISRLIINEVKSRSELYDRMVRKRSLPYSELIKLDGVTKKILERHRKYLIASIEILCGDFPQMAEFINNL